MPKAHEGSNPSLCARRFNLTHSGWIEPFLLAHRKWILTMRRTSQGSHLSVAIGVAKRRESVRKQLSVVFPRAWPNRSETELARKRQVSVYSSLMKFPDHRHSSWVSFCFGETPSKALSRRSKFLYKISTAQCPRNYLFITLSTPASPYDILSR